MRPTKGFLIGSFAAAFFCASNSSAFAEKCYEPQTTEPKLVCADNRSGSADFSLGCNYMPGEVIQVEVACPSKWVNAFDKESHNATCERVGLTPVSIEGSFCASGELRPSVGLDWETISYKHGKWGGLDVRGGDSVTYRNDSTYSLGKDSPVREVKGGWYCYDGGKKDFDNTDRVVAYACGK